MIAGRITLTKQVPRPRPEAARDREEMGVHRADSREDGQHHREEPEQHAERDLRGGPRPKKSIRDGYHTTLGIA